VEWVYFNWEKRNTWANYFYGFPLLLLLLLVKRK
jgi:hypothetical protein